MFLLFLASNTPDRDEPVGTTAPGVGVPVQNRGANQLYFNAVLRGGSFFLEEKNGNKTNSKSKNSKFQKLIIPEPNEISIRSKRLFIQLDNIRPYTIIAKICCHKCSQKVDVKNDQRFGRSVYNSATLLTRSFFSF